ncbi:MAG: HesB/IscA family protein [Chthoniobacterales bacterium]
MIQITDSAAQELLRLSEEKGLGTEGGLRLAVENGGCAGMQYAMSIGESEENDFVAEHAGARVFVNSESLVFLEGSVIDYEDGLMNTGFRIKNPKAARSCGCGTSFEPTD